jgi:hypothetical protein
MGYLIVTKDDIQNAILAAHQTAQATAARSLYADAAWLDGFTTALEAVATGLGVRVELPEPETWRVVGPGPARLLESSGEPARLLEWIERGGNGK